MFRRRLDVPSVPIRGGEKTPRRVPPADDAGPRHAATARRPAAAAAVATTPPPSARTPTPPATPPPRRGSTSSWATSPRVDGSSASAVFPTPVTALSQRVTELLRAGRLLEAHRIASAMAGGDAVGASGAVVGALCCARTSLLLGRLDAAEEMYARCLRWRSAASLDVPAGDADAACAARAALVEAPTVDALRRAAAALEITSLDGGATLVSASVSVTALSAAARGLDAAIAALREGAKLVAPPSPLAIPGDALAAPLLLARAALPVTTPPTRASLVACRTLLRLPGAAAGDEPAFAVGATATLSSPRLDGSAAARRWAPTAAGPALAAAPSPEGLAAMAVVLLRLAPLTPALLSLAKDYADAAVSLRAAHAAAAGCAMTSLTRETTTCAPAHDGTTAHDGTAPGEIAHLHRSSSRGSPVIGEAQPPGLLDVHSVASAAAAAAALLAAATSPAAALDGKQTAWRQAWAAFCKAGAAPAAPRGADDGSRDAGAGVTTPPSGTAVSSLRLNALLSPTWGGVAAFALRCRAETVLRALAACDAQRASPSSAPVTPRPLPCDGAAPMDSLTRRALALEATLNSTVSECAQLAARHSADGVGLEWARLRVVVSLAFAGDGGGRSGFELDGAERRELLSAARAVHGATASAAQWLPTLVPEAAAATLAAAAHVARLVPECERLVAGAETPADARRGSAASTGAVGDAQCRATPAAGEAPPIPPAAPRDHYEALCLPRTATAREVAKAFRRIALRWHPDRRVSAPAPVAPAPPDEAPPSVAPRRAVPPPLGLGLASIRRDAAEREGKKKTHTAAVPDGDGEAGFATGVFVRASAAYEVLGDPDRRRAYDAALA